MEQRRISSFKSTVWASVTLDTIKSTPVWKKYSDANGSVPSSKMNNVLRASMIQLGYDDNNETSYRRRPEKVMVRSSGDQTKGILTEVYDFPVKLGHELENYYLTAGLVNFNTDDKTKEVSLAEFGTEYYDTSSNKQNKKKSREEFVHDLAMKSMANDDNSLYM